MLPSEKPGAGHEDHGLSPWWGWLICFHISSTNKITAQMGFYAPAQEPNAVRRKPLSGPQQASGLLWTYGLLTLLTWVTPSKLCSGLSREYSDGYGGCSQPHQPSECLWKAKNSHLLVFPVRPNPRLVQAAAQPQFRMHGLLESV